MQIPVRPGMATLPRGRHWQQPTWDKARLLPATVCPRFAPSRLQTLAGCPRTACCKRTDYHRPSRIASVWPVSRPTRGRTTLSRSASIRVTIFSSRTSGPSSDDCNSSRTHDPASQLQSSNLLRPEGSYCWWWTSSARTPRLASTL